MLGIMYYFYQLRGRWCMDSRLTEDCTAEHKISRTEMEAVDAGTQAGIHVPVGDF